MQNVEDMNEVPSTENEMDAMRRLNAWSRARPSRWSSLALDADAEVAVGDPTPELWRVTLGGIVCEGGAQVQVERLSLATALMEAIERAEVKELDFFYLQRKRRRLELSRPGLSALIGLAEEKEGTDDEK